MCRLVRCTVRRATRCTVMRARVWRERRRRCSLLFNMIQRSLLLLGLFEGDLLVRVADALALVRLGGANGSNFSGDLTHRLAVRSLDDNFGLRRALDLDASRHVFGDRMREADLQVQLGTRRLGAEA